ncbi:hypothetical protein DFH07DRAFT_766063 [Mycena maculata]|uniref:Uncharacterized protein n=1 Tax=Mycena maculata TaxID=230809 RepID=A0AAD7K3N1_9AGAR|nr:hypothetical protein DFH07DRAFT_766063 [Mycena maculata]
MTNLSPKYLDDFDPNFLAFLANLSIADELLPPATSALRAVPVSPLPPRTPSPSPPSDASHRHTFPSARPRTYTADPLDRPSIYRIQSTTEWAWAGFATQGIHDTSVCKIQVGERSKKPRFDKAAYVVFCGRRLGVFLTWYVLIVAGDQTTGHRCPQLHLLRLPHQGQGRRGVPLCTGVFMGAPLERPRYIWHPCTTLPDWPHQ